MPVARRALGLGAVGFHRFGKRAGNKLFSLLISGAFRSFGAHSVLELPLRVTGEEKISIGSDVFIGAGSWLQVLDRAKGDLVIQIGDGTSIVGACVVSAASSVRIGRAVLIARNVYIADHMHAFEDTKRPVMHQGIGRVGPVEIGDGAWLGENVVVGPGVRIGSGAVVGANAVVLDDVPDFAVAAGVPAKVIRLLGTPDH